MVVGSAWCCGSSLRSSTLSSSSTTVCQGFCSCSSTAPSMLAVGVVGVVSAVGVVASVAVVAAAARRRERDDAARLTIDGRFFNDSKRVADEEVGTCAAVSTRSFVGRRLNTLACTSFTRCLSFNVCIPPGTEPPQGRRDGDDRGLRARSGPREEREGIWKHNLSSERTTDGA